MNSIDGVDPRATSRDVASDRHQLIRLQREIELAVRHGRGASVAAPAPLMSELVRGTVREVADALVERLANHPATAARDGEELVAVAGAAAAWVETYAALLAIEWFELAD